MTVRQTSAEAYHTIQANGLLSKRRWEIYDALYRHGPKTGSELFKCLTLYGENPTHSNIVTRLGELRDLGVAAEVGKKECEVSGMRVILWDVTDNLPKGSIAHAATKRELMIQMREHLLEMSGHLKTQANVPQRWQDWADRAIELATQAKKWSD